MDRSKQSLGLAVLGGCALAGAAKARGTDTHGRWPWLAAIAAPPATTALYGSRGRLQTPGQAATWIALPLLLWHQTEEWVLPAGFMPWFNRTVWKSQEDEFPLSPQIGFRVNVLAGWFLSVLAAVSARRTPSLASAVLASHAANGALHVGLAIGQRRYNPGLGTGIALGALGVTGTMAAIREATRPREAALGALGGLAASGALPLVLRRQMTGAPARTQ